MTTEMTVIALGVHVLDMLARPVVEIPEGQGGTLIDEIRVTAAGPAGGYRVGAVQARRTCPECRSGGH